MVGAPPKVHMTPANVDTDSEHEHEHDEEAERQQHELAHEHDADEGIDELMSAFGDEETYIDLTHLRIHSMRSLGLQRFGKTLTNLILRQNEIHTMRGKDLSALPHLKELDLYDNQIEHITGVEDCKELECVQRQPRLQQSAGSLFQQHSPYFTYIGAAAPAHFILGAEQDCTRTPE